MIKVDSGLGDDFYAVVSESDTSVSIEWFDFDDDSAGELHFTPEGGMNLAAALVREIHGASEPRVWESADDVPDGVKVSFDWPSVGIRHTIRYGDVWVFFNDAGKSELWNYVVHLPDYYSPFVEVL